jgi:SPP1 family predicted phage head-tail adaptor
MATQWTHVGEMRCLVVIERPTASEPDAYGEVVDSWLPVVSGWAKIADENGREVYRAKQVKPAASHVLNMPYCDGVVESCRIFLPVEGVYLYVEHVSDIMHFHRELSIIATQRISPAPALVTPDELGVETRVVAQWRAWGALTALIGNRIRPEKLHQSDIIPAIVYHSDREPQNTSTQTVGNVARIIVECQGMTYATMRAVAKETRAALAVPVSQWPVVAGAPTIGSCLCTSDGSEDVDIEPSQDVAVNYVVQTFEVNY